MTATDRVHQIAFVALGCVLNPQVASAHVSHQGFVLLLPTDAYIAAGCLAVAVTILFVALVPEKTTRGLFDPFLLGASPNLEGAKAVTSAVVTCCLAGLLWIGWTGSRDPLSNLLPLSVWTVWWMGFVVLQGLVGDLWSWINPWRGIFGLVTRGSRAPFRIPDSWGQWPAVILLLLFWGFILADLAPDDPERLALIIGLYSLFTWCGMALFGIDPWCRQVEFVSVFLNLYARLAPIQTDRSLRIGTPGWGLIQTPNMRVSLAVFCIFLLGSGSFDGINETFWWLQKIGINPLEFPGRSAVIWQTLGGLLATNVLLLLAYSFVVWVGVRLAGEPAAGFHAAFCQLAVTLIPIAFGYHFAHFFTSFLVDVQYARAALTDPLTRGDDLLGLGQVYVTTGFFFEPSSVRAIWLTQAGAIVIVHMIAVLLAHRVALDLFGSNRKAILGLVPMSLFMLGYTLLGLWLLASPRGA